MLIVAVNIIDVRRLSRRVNQRRIVDCREGCGPTPLPFVLQGRPAPVTLDVHLKDRGVVNESERSEYCRERGLYPEQIDAWREAFESADTEAPASKAELAAERKKSRALEKELRRKEKALAEAAALLTLSKKWQAIWGTNEDD